MGSGESDPIRDLSRPIGCPRDLRAEQKYRCQLSRLSVRKYLASWLIVCSAFHLLVPDIGNDRVLLHRFLPTNFLVGRPAGYECQFVHRNVAQMTPDQKAAAPERSEETTPPSRAFHATLRAAPRR